MSLYISSEITPKAKLCSEGEAAVIIFDHKDSSYRFAAADMQHRMKNAGYTVTLADIGIISEVVAENRIILTARGSREADIFLEQPGISPLQASVSQGYSIRKKSCRGCTEWYIIGCDRNGAMYGGLDFGEAVQMNGFDGLVDFDGKPFISDRGIKFNIPLDARTPSYSDSGDSAQANISNIWDMDFWKKFMDEMAKNRFNVLSLWSLHPFPSMVKVPEYPDVALSDVKRTTVPITADLQGMKMSTPESLKNLETLKIMTIDEKIDFWRNVMLYACDRGIDIYIFTWNTFVYGTEHTGYGFTTSVTDTKTQHYFRKSVEALIKTYPLLKGIGVTAGENMSRNADLDEAWLFNAYGKGINDALAADENRTFRLIHRIQYSNIGKALDAFAGLNSRCMVDTSFKYSQAHVYSSTKPDYIHANDGAYFKDITGHKTWLTVRDDDYYMFRGGSDPEFIRKYIKSMPYEKMQGFYLGPDGYTWGREYISKEPEMPNQMVIKKRWFSFMLWGRLAFDPEIPDEHFIKVLELRFPKVDAKKLFEAWARASRIIPLVNRMHNGGCQLDFQWYPEACTSNTGFHGIDRFIQAAPQSGEGIMSIPEYADVLLKRSPMTGTTPVEIADRLFEHSFCAMKTIQGMSAGNDRELRHTLLDIDALAALGRYYSRKILGAVNKCISELAMEEEKLQYREAALENLKEASGYWREYSEKAGVLYNRQTLTRMIPNPMETPGLPRYTDIAELQKDVDNDYSI
ncbi:MAG: carbohydrate-binding family 6 protein [Chitinophagaceae bacterium]|nr:carbohydrate-binding family 6 protein [Chitinophagaceae bacterium]